MNTALQLLPEDIRLERSSARRRNAPESIFIPKIVCPPRHEQATWKFGVFGGMHGDEEAGILASHELADWALTLPDEAQDFELHFYPVCNPSGRAVGTRHSMGGYDLNREFWVGSSQPEVAYLEGEIRREAYDGIISLHTDDESAGIYGFASGALLSQQILEPALEAAGKIIPRNPSPYIDGFAADRGIITEGYFGVLSAPPEQRPHALEIVFETPDYVRMELQVQATVAAVKTILTEYRRLQAYAQNL